MNIHFDTHLEAKRFELYVKSGDIEYYDELADATRQQMWAQQINMDDWDYLLFIPFPWSSNFNGSLSALLKGCCTNEWHVGDFQHRRGLIGVAYHS